MGEFAEWKKKKSGNEKIENSYIVGFCDIAFYINGWLIEEVKTFEAIGAGMDFALAAMHMGHSAKEAVQTACELSVFCEQPIQVIKKLRDP
jgi:ATP-dependent protease HslVU (ClpYQ) peptidase subunit